jgi:hypothetical protein
MLNAGNIVSYNNLYAQSDQITNSGTLSASNSLDINGLVLNNTGSLLSEKNINLTLEQLLNTGTMSSNEQINLNSLTLNNMGSILSENVSLVSDMQNSGTIEGGSVWLKGNILNTSKITGWNLLDIETSDLTNTNVSMTINGIKAGTISERDKENMDIPGPYSWGGVDITKMTKEDQAAIQKGVLQGGAIGAGAATMLIAPEFVVPYLNTLSYSAGAKLVTTLYTTGQVVNNVANKMGNTYTNLGARAYGVQTAVQNFSTNYPKIAPYIKTGSEIVWGYNGPLKEAPSTLGGTIGTGLFIIDKYGHPVQEFLSKSNQDIK